MSPKKAIIILVIFTLAITTAAAYLYTKQQPVDELAQTITPSDADIEAAPTDLTKEEQEKLVEQKVEEKVEEKMKAIEAKPEEVIRTQGYTQAELDFIANPRATAEKELGIATSSAPEIKVYTQEELDDIANPK